MLQSMGSQNVRLSDLTVNFLTKNYHFYIKSREIVGTVYLLFS